MMKKLINILIAITFIAMASCVEDKRDHSSRAHQEEQLDEQQSTAVDDDGVQEQAESTSADEDDTETITQDSDSTVNKENNESEEESPSQARQNDADTEGGGEVSWMGFVAILFAVVSLLLCLYIIYFSRKREGEIWSKLDGLEKDIERKWMQTNRAFKECATDKDMRTVQDDIQRIIQYIKGIKKDFPKPTQKENKGGNTPIPPEKVIKRTGYFGIVRSNGSLSLFNEYSDYVRDNSFFKVEFIDERNCNFYPFDLEKIRASDAAKNAVDYIGCSIQYAKSMTVKEKGFAVLEQNDYWRLIDKAVVELKN